MQSMGCTTHKFPVYATRDFWNKLIIGHADSRVKGHHIADSAVNYKMLFCLIDHARQ